MSPVSKVVQLINSHPGSFKECPGCKMCKQIQHISNQWEKDVTNKQWIRSVLDKGKDMTKSDFIFLLDHGVTRRDIQKATKMESGEFHRMLHAWGLNKNKKRKESVGNEKAH